MYSYKYIAMHGSSDEGTIDDADEFECLFEPSDPEFVATLLGEHYYDNCDGWESSWPLDFKIWQVDGTELGVFTVELEHAPQFSSCRRQPDE